MKKRLMSLVLALVMCLSLLPLGTLAEDDGALAMEEPVVEGEPIIEPESAAEPEPIMEETDAQWNRLSIDSDNEPLVNAALHSSHSYMNPVWTWSTDYSTAEAKFICEMGDSTVTETGVISSVRTEPTCAEEGCTFYTATVIFEGEEYTDEQFASIAKLAHTPGKAIQENEMAATCVTAGSYDEVVYCTECGEELSRDTKTIDKIAHEEMIIYGFDATCTEAGLTDGKECSECGAILVAQEIIPATGHKWDTGVVTEDATFDTEGVMTYTCSVCGETWIESISRVPPIDLSTANMAIAVSDQVYAGERLEPEVSVTVNGINLREYIDYIVTYSNNVNAGTATLTVTGIDHYTGAVTKSFTIAAAPIGSATVTLSCDGYTYDGKEKKPKPTVELDDVTLRKNTDYSVSYQSNVNAGTAKVTITGKGNYTGTATKSFKIKQASNVISVSAGSAIAKTSSTSKTQTLKLGASALASATLTYSCKSTPTGVKVSKGKVTIPKNYTGKATITITAKATKNYKKTTKTVTITVKPVKPTLSSVKSSAAQKITAAWKKTPVNVSGYQLEYATKKDFSNSKTIKVKGTANTIKTISNLQEGTTYYIRVRTYRTSGKTTLYSAWSTAKNATVETSKTSPPSTASETTPTTVYVSRTGIIHSRSNCSGMKYYSTMTLEAALRLGYRKCKKCPF